MNTLLFWTVVLIMNFHIILDLESRNCEAKLFALNLLHRLKKKSKHYNYNFQYDNFQMTLHFAWRSFHFFFWSYRLKYKVNTMENGEVTTFHMAHKGDLRQIQAIIQEEPRYGNRLMMIRKPVNFFFTKILSWFLFFFVKFS